MIRTDPADRSAEVPKDGRLRVAHLPFGRQLSRHVHVPEQRPQPRDDDGGEEEDGREDDDGDDFEHHEDGPFDEHLSDSLDAVVHCESVRIVSDETILEDARYSCLSGCLRCSG